MPKDDYVTTANAFVDATSADYASLFQQSLDCSLDGTGDVQRKLTCLPDDALRLEFCNTIRLLNSARSIRYAFDLQPVAVDRIQILEAKMRDHQEALNQFGAHLDTRPRCPVHLYVESDVKQTESKLKWKPLDNGNFVVVEKERTAIRAHVPGLYALAVVVNHEPRARDGGAISLCINGLKIQRAATDVSHFTAGPFNPEIGTAWMYAAPLNNIRRVGTAAARCHTSASLMCLARVEKEAQFSVICTNIAPAKGFVSHLTVVRIME
ncbi:hypothetical protein PF005_g24830 [Phytophthora fragariae]|uniref:Uncharacterized protein n=1 Tax=Phytophthora fragariae TaxID=53985 RepID=A0A6A3IK84_9STRA|nr:hypothetical protein PF009_g25624 [Phytophthora fragariae]KAE8980514.1 hypothetical protein PF011_g22412 [Phytophthora fragariae]KAE9075890.1 hypothetical protein PF007_g24832 [Phytophthora fragariae]KAE9106113.1 hypothetical protein PF010_g12734 [Phytophthora fragariae]KAE9176655.1 hypothetical protein PF005_g24830 [Phytophthora fragariae]